MRFKVDRSQVDQLMRTTAIIDDWNFEMGGYGQTCRSPKRMFFEKICSCDKSLIIGHNKMLDWKSIGNAF